MFVVRIAVLALMFWTALFVSFETRADVTESPASLIAKSYQDATGKHRLVEINFCELGECKPIGLKYGYFEKEWHVIEGLCSAEAIFVQPLMSALKQAAQIAALAPGPTRIGAMAIYGALEAQGSYGKEVQAANDGMQGVVLNLGNFELSHEDFDSLLKGIRFCTSLYDKMLQRDRNARYQRCRVITPRANCEASACFAGDIAAASLRSTPFGAVLGDPDDLTDRIAPYSACPAY